jgi:diguanylate cyclase (GGDEF)-like protein/PAS domain S-box-containing protein
LKNNNIELVHKEFNQLKRLQNIISRSVLYTTSDIDAKITSVSKAFQELTGYNEEELIGRSHSIFRDPATPDEFYKNMWNILDKNEKFVGEMKNFGKNKEVFWIKITIDPMFDDNNTKIGYASYRENITNTKKLEYISTHDTLTNIYNRAFFNDTIETKIKSAKRYGIEFSLIIIDIDHFKKVNDQYGHNIGDKVLIEIAKILKDNIREDDVVARWGGEEFVILLSHTDIDGTYQLAEKLRVIIENTIIENIRITASFGLASYNKRLSKNEFFEIVDKSLYKAKDNGRNCIVKS